MSKLRSLMAWPVVFTQVWSPVLAQTLPISVDRSVPGARPFVSVSHGVPVVNIAPPSAGGVSNNRYTQFNVGPSGVVLNNSGGASPSQLAGQVDGNPMLAIGMQAPFSTRSPRPIRRNCSARWKWLEIGPTSSSPTRQALRAMAADS